MKIKSEKTQLRERISELEEMKRFWSIDAQRARRRYERKRDLVFSSIFIRKSSATLREELKKHNELILSIQEHIDMLSNILLDANR